MTPQCRTRKESQGKTARHATLNAGNVGNVGSAVSARSAAGGASARGAQSAVANAIAAMAMPMSRATAVPMCRRLMHAARVARNLAAMGEARAAVKVAVKVVGRAGTSAGQTATRVSMKQCKREMLPSR